MAKSKQVAEFGDFQTPADLANQVCHLLRRRDIAPASLLEPTCGWATFLEAGLNAFPNLKSATGLEINSDYLRQAESRLSRSGHAGKYNFQHADFFHVDWDSVVRNLSQPILILGNLPWVTNSQLGVLQSDNLPEKSNFQNRRGLDAITGKSNFDISEWMLLRLFEALQRGSGTVAMLVKSAVARKALAQAWQAELPIEWAAIYFIDAKQHFNAAVDAVLLLVQFGQRVGDQSALVHDSLESIRHTSRFGYADSTLVANLDAYQETKHLAGEEPLKWRSGVKHDCSSVMEFVREGSRYRNGLGELVELEDSRLYPMLKSSHVASSCVPEHRYMLITQQRVGDETSAIQYDAPRTWAYLNRHAEALDRRASSIYRKRPRFSVFGVGDYAFAPWKVAISGFYKRLSFSVLGPVDEKPIVLDDTCYFLPLQTEAQARFIADLLNSPRASQFFSSYIFWDAKRPITAELLRRLKLRALSEDLGRLAEFEQLFSPRTQQLQLW